MANRFSRVAMASALLLAAGCSRQGGIQTYKVAKEDDTASPPMMAGNPASEAHPSVPRVHWELPKGWIEQKAEQMVTAAFQVQGKDGQTVQVTIIPLPGFGKKELETVNMWRQSLGLEDLKSDQLDGLAQMVDVDGGKGQLFDIAGTAPKNGGKFKSRLLGVMADRDDVTWFVKMVGDDPLVEEQKPALLTFLKSLSFEAPTPQMAAAEDRPISTNTRTTPPGAGSWKVPTNWQQRAPGPMISAAYDVTGDNGSAEVTVSHFGGDVGGMIANVNRWRGQLGLPPQGPQEIQSSVRMLDVNGRKDAYSVDLEGVNVRTGKQTHLLAIAVPRGDETWFYKLMGDDAVVEKEKTAFQQFAMSAY